MRLAPWKAYLLVAAGSALGGCARLLLSDGTPGDIAASFPRDNLLVNVLGSLLIGFYAGLPATTRWTGDRAHLFFSAGFCGGFTTFSLFSLEMLQLVDAGRTGLAVAFLGISIVSWLAAVSLGYLTARRITIGTS